VSIVRHHRGTCLVCDVDPRGRHCSFGSHHWYHDGRVERAPRKLAAGAEQEVERASLHEWLILSRQLTARAQHLAGTVPSRHVVVESVPRGPHGTRHAPHPSSLRFANVAMFGHWQMLLALVLMPHDCLLERLMQDTGKGHYNLHTHTTNHGVGFYRLA
jgi:hypothetical protein